LAKPKDTQNSARANKNKIDIEIDENSVRVQASKDPKSANDKQNQSESNPTDNTAEEIPATEALAREKDKYLRLAAEYDNFRKRSAKERDTIYSNAKADIIGKLLPVYDNLERALKMECADEAYYKGIEMTMQQLTEVLKGLGVNPIPTVGEPFDPNLHDAVMRIEDPKLGEGIIAEECKKGFALGDRVIRFSTVVVAN